MKIYQPCTVCKGTGEIATGKGNVYRPCTSCTMVRVEEVNPKMERGAGWVCDGDTILSGSSVLGIIANLRSAITEHYAQKADDRCFEDDDRLYAAAGLPPCDRRVGDKADMLVNCARFIERRCEVGGWPSYRELEATKDELLAACKRVKQYMDNMGMDWLGKKEDPLEAAISKAEKLSG